MPLADITNALQPTRSKRFSLGSDITPKGENVAPASHLPSPKETPARVNRFLAPTKASAAKTTPERNRAQPHAGRNTPISNSKLPRRGGAPILTPPTSKWSTTSASGVGLFAKSVQSSKSSPLLREVSESEDCPSPVSCIEGFVRCSSAYLAVTVAFSEHAFYRSTYGSHREAVARSPNCFASIRT